MARRAGRLSGFAPGHDNRAMPLHGREWRAAVTLEGKPLADALIDRLGQWRDFRPNFSALPGNMAATFQPEGGGLGSADNPAIAAGRRPAHHLARAGAAAAGRPAGAGARAWTLVSAGADATVTSRRDCRRRHATRRNHDAQDHPAVRRRARLMLVALVVPIRCAGAAAIGIGDGGDAQLALSIRVQANSSSTCRCAAAALLLELCGRRRAGRPRHHPAVGAHPARHRPVRSSGVSFGRFWGTALTWLACWRWRWRAVAAAPGSRHRTERRNESDPNSFGALSGNQAERSPGSDFRRYPAARDALVDVTVRVHPIALGLLRNLVAGLHAMPGGAMV